MASTSLTWPLKDEENKAETCIFYGRTTTNTLRGNCAVAKQTAALLLLLTADDDGDASKSVLGICAIGERQEDFCGSLCPGVLIPGPSFGTFWLVR